MAPLPPRTGHRLLRCPICRLDLVPRARTLACGNGHSFDIAREGYVNLHSGARRRPAAGGDTAEQLRHRASFLDAGHFQVFAETIAQHLSARGDRPSSRPWCVLDTGCGTGHHLARTIAALALPAIGLGIDISAAASRHAARRWPDHAFAAADLWRDWPVRNAAADLVLSIFAPKNFNETARVLRPGGWLAMVYPGQKHLIELGRQLCLVRQHPAKDERYSEAAKHVVGPCRLVRSRSMAILDVAAIRDLLLMGPNARHIEPSALGGLRNPLVVTFDVVILFAQRIG